MVERHLLLWAMLMLALPGGGWPLRAEVEGESSGQGCVATETPCVVRIREPLGAHRPALERSGGWQQSSGRAQPTGHLPARGHRLPSGGRAPLRC